jgi:hypothetical protein
LLVMRLLWAISCAGCGSAAGPPGGWALVCDQLLEVAFIYQKRGFR